MEISGKIIQVLDPSSGTSARGEWKRQDFIIETLDQYPKKVCISNWNNKVDLENTPVNSEVTISINIESREFNGKWYTDVRAWKMESTNQTTPNNIDTFPTEVPPPTEDLSENDLPF